mmetsp:Transcript_11532/g.28421  ORF Transcript_11532/g.28421 Transcript_11532/m.28421 type:complete len:339 (-) Transcript_11532:294-1310(-)
MVNEVDVVGAPVAHEPRSLAPGCLIALAVCLLGAALGKGIKRLCRRTSVEEEVRGANNRLILGYAALSGLSVFMVFWVLVLPGSCRHMLGLAESPLSDPKFYDDKPFVVARTLVSKYRETTLVCFTHVLPSAIWSAVIPFQFHPLSRSTVLLRKIHRFSGRVFLILSGLLMFGLFHLEIQGLGYQHADYPEFKAFEHVSMIFPDHILSEFLVMITWFVFTAFMTLYSITSFTWGTFRKSRDVASHQKWILRHTITGLGVALQRLSLFILIGGYKLYDAFTTGSVGDGIPAKYRKMMFGDAMLLAIVLGVAASEAALEDIAIINNHAPHSSKNYHLKGE